MRASSEYSGPYSCAWVPVAVLDATNPGQACKLTPARRPMAGTCRTPVASVKLTFTDLWYHNLDHFLYFHSPNFFQ